MSTNKLSHLTEWDKIYLEVTRKKHNNDDASLLWFVDASWYKYWVCDNDIFYFPDDLKQLANDGMPKQGEMIEARYKTEWGEFSNWYLFKFVCMHEWKVLVDNWMKILKYDEWRYRPQKTELTLAEVEERLGLDTWSLIIK